MTSPIALVRPLLATVARLLREADAGLALDHGEVRTEIQNRFAAMNDAVAGDPPLAAQYRRLEPALFFFVDYMIKEGPFPFAGAWQELAFRIDEVAGDEKFFELLDECLDDPGAEAADRLRVFYECLLLGFDGVHADEPKWIHRRMQVVALRLGLAPQGRPPSFPVEPAGPGTAPAPFHHPASLPRRLAGWALLALAVALIGNYAVYRWASHDLRLSLRRVLANAEGGERMGLLRGDGLVADYLREDFAAPAPEPLPPPTPPANPPAGSTTSGAGRD